MKVRLFLLAVLLLPISCFAQSSSDGVSIKSAVRAWPKEYIRTAKALVIPPQHKKIVTFELWLSLAANGVDAYSTEYGLHHCPSCVEIGPFYGAHPSRGRLIGVAIPVAFTETMLEEAIWRVGEPIEAHIGAGLIAGFHLFAAAHNYAQ